DDRGIFPGIGCWKITVNKFCNYLYRMEKIIMITGATSGFGKAIAEKFATNGWNCIITGRRKERLLEVAKELTDTFNVNILPLVFDVQVKEDVFNEINGLPGEWKNIDVLVNNA